MVCVRSFLFVVIHKIVVSVAFVVAVVVVVAPPTASNISRSMAVQKRSMHAWNNAWRTHAWHRIIHGVRRPHLISSHLNLNLSFFN
jgi:hypothetical protein